MGIETLELEHLGLVAGVFDQLEIAEVIDDRIPKLRNHNLEQSKVIKSMILNALGFVGQRLGHSKDGRMDLKQFVLGLVTNQDGIPLFSKAYSGNASDKNTIIEAFMKPTFRTLNLEIPNFPAINIGNIF